MARALQRHQDLGSRGRVIRRQVVIFASDLPQAALDPFGGDVSLTCFNAASSNDTHTQS